MHKPFLPTAKRLALAFAWMAAGLCVPALAVQMSEENLSTPDGTRNFLLAQPDAGDNRLRPLVLVFHGHGGSAAQALGQKNSAAPMSLWLKLADREGLVVAALDGSTRGDGKPGWNDCRRDAVGNPPTDDVGFAREVIRKLVATAQVDPQRVYAMGMSNGAMMTFRLAQELEPPLAGFAAVSGLMAADNLCQPARHAVPALVIMGTADPLVPYGGGQVQFAGHKRGGVLSADDTVAQLRKTNQALAGPVVSQIPNSDRRDATSAQRIHYGSLQGKARVNLIRIEGGGHVEPSRSQQIGRLYSRLVGPQNHDFEAVEEAWRFFQGSR